MHSQGSQTSANFLFWKKEKKGKEIWQFPLPSCFPAVGGHWHSHWFLFLCENFRLVSLRVPAIKDLMETLFCHLYKWTSIILFRLHLLYNMCADSSVFVQIFLTMLKHVSWIFNPQLYNRLGCNTNDYW